MNQSCFPCEKCIRGFLQNTTVNKNACSCRTELLQIVYPLDPSDIKWPVTRMHRANHSLNWTPKQAAATQWMLSLRRLFSFHIVCSLSNKASGQSKALQHSCLLKSVVCSSWLVSKMNSNPLIARNNRKCLQWLGTVDNYTRWHCCVKPTPFLQKKKRVYQLLRVQNGGPVLLCSFEQWTRLYKQGPSIIISMCTRAHTRFKQGKKGKKTGSVISLCEYTQKVFFTDCGKQRNLSEMASIQILPNFSCRCKSVQNLTWNATKIFQI